MGWGDGDMGGEMARSLMFRRVFHISDGQIACSLFTDLQHNLMSSHRLSQHVGNSSQVT